MNLKNCLLLVVSICFFVPTIVTASGKTFTEHVLDGKKIELARYAKVFVDQGNVKIEVAPYKIGSQEGAILVFHGIESPWDGKAINHTVRDLGYGSIDYETEYNGKKWVTITSRKYSGYFCYVPGVKDEIPLYLSAKAAGQTNPEKIFQEYRRQQEKHEGREK